MNKYQEKVNNMIESNQAGISFFNIFKNKVMIGGSSEYTSDKVVVEFMIKDGRAYNFEVNGAMSDEEIYMEIFFMIAGVFKKSFADSSKKKAAS